MRPLLRRGRQQRCHGLGSWTVALLTTSRTRPSFLRRSLTTFAQDVNASWKQPMATASSTNTSSYNWLQVVCLPRPFGTLSWPAGRRPRFPTIVGPSVGIYFAGPAGSVVPLCSAQSYSRARLRRARTDATSAAVLHETDARTHPTPAARKAVLNNRSPRWQLCPILVLYRS